MQVDALKAEVKAVELGHQARRLKNGSFAVKSESEPGVTRIVTYVGIALHGGVQVRFDCTCPSGTDPRRAKNPVKCWHSAAAGRRLEREGFAHWHNGAWWIKDAVLERHGLKAAAPVIDLWPS